MHWDGWWLAFAVTLATEAPVYLWALRKSLGMRRAAAAALALNAATHPLAWSAIMTARHPFPSTFLAVEAAVWVVEALLLWLVCRTSASKRRWRFIETLALSLAANGFSAGIGLLL